MDSYEKAASNMLMIDRDELVPSYRKLTGAVHAAVGTTVMQFFHGSSSSRVDRGARHPYRRHPRACGC